MEKIFKNNLLLDGYKACTKKCWLEMNQFNSVKSSYKVRSKKKKVRSSPNLFQLLGGEVLEISFVGDQLYMRVVPISSPSLPYFSQPSMESAGSTEGKFAALFGYWTIVPLRLDASALTTRLSTSSVTREVIPARPCSSRPGTAGCSGCCEQVHGHGQPAMIFPDPSFVSSCCKKMQ